MSQSQKSCLIINGGEIEVFAGDDCFDSNGSIEINGGVIKATKVDGQFVGFNSILDADGSVSIAEGVTLIAAGSGGTQGTFEISQNSITVYCDETQSAGTNVTLSDEKGNTICEYAPSGKFSAVLITSPSLKTGKTYTVTIGSEENTAEISDQSTTIGTNTTGSGRGRK
jgi:hypothetical protein